MANLVSSPAYDQFRLINQTVNSKKEATVNSSGFGLVSNSAFDDYKLINQPVKDRLVQAEPIKEKAN